MAEASPYGKKGKGKGKEDARKSRKVLEQHDAPALRFEDSEPLPYSDPLSHYHIESSSTRYHINIYNWLGKHESDPAIKVSFHGTIEMCINYDTRTFYLDLKTTYSLACLG
jgi:hypothetical protein